MKKAVAYVRVSTEGQTTENQRLAIEGYCRSQGWQLTKVYEDAGVSGAVERRPGLDELKADVAKGKFGVVLVWKFDRLARSTSHLLETLALFQRYGVDFCSTTEAIDSSVPAGKMVLTFLGAIAEFERSLIVERVHAGLERAKSQGVKLGRPRKGMNVARAIQLRNEGWGFKRIADELGVPRSNVFRALGAIPKTPVACPD